jgi:hypothetical protein
MQTLPLKENKEGTRMHHEVNEEEAWLIHAIKTFDEIVTSSKYGPLFFQYLSEDAKIVLMNMTFLEKAGYKGKLWELHLA